MFTKLNIVKIVFFCPSCRLIHSTIPDPSAFNNLAESLQRLATLKAIEVSSFINVYEIEDCSGGVET